MSDLNNNQDATMRKLVLCAGLQSGGTTLVSWCFLQRPDMDGILDMQSDLLDPIPPLQTPFGWCKMTISSFRWSEVADWFRLQRWEPVPLLVARDVRHAYASLKKKPYGRNGNTAEDPPLRLRMMRFLEVWREFAERGWPILRFETLLEEPEAVLRAACNQLQLPWYEDMLTWPKPLAAIADHRFGSPTFLNELPESGIYSALSKKPAVAPALSIEDCAWLEDAFREYNQVNRYPAHLAPEPDDSAAIQEPSFSATVRNELHRELGVLKHEVNAFKQEVNRLRAILARRRYYGDGPLVRRLLHTFPYPRRMINAVRLWREERWLD